MPSEGVVLFKLPLETDEALYFGLVGQGAIPGLFDSKQAADRHLRLIHSRTRLWLS
jgi:hypothetical protein